MSRKNYFKKISNLFGSSRSEKKEINKGILTGGGVYFLGATNPIWINVQDYRDLERLITHNPVAFGAIDILSKHFANGRVKLKKLSTGQIISKENISGSDNNKTVNKAFDLFDNPNVLQSRWEYLRLMMFFKKGFGNSYTYGLKPNSMKMNIDNVAALWQVWPQYMNVIMQGNYFTATRIEEIIKEWRFGYLGSKGTRFDPNEVLHRKEINIELEQPEDIIYGKSPLIPLKKPLSNVEKAYETENVVLKNRGVRFVVTPDTSNQDEISSGEPMGEDEKKELQEDWKGYGLLDDQYSAMVTRIPSKVAVIDQDMKKLGTHDTISHNAMVVAHDMGIPEILMKLYIQGATYENQNIALVRLYEDTIIPEFDDYITDLNNFLNMKESGYVYVSSWDHIALLQEDKKNKATANSLTSKQYADKFMKGACTYNEWRRSTGDSEEPWGNVRIFDLDDQQLQYLGINLNTESNGQES